MTLAFEEIDRLRSHPAWVLLRANNAPLVMSFLGRVFVDRNTGDLPSSQLAGELDDELYALNQHSGDNPPFPKNAAEYLDDWAAPERGWLRKFYRSGTDEACFALTPAVEKALLWTRELIPREFIGTESRLNTIFDLLRQMVYGADENPEIRLAELHRRRAEIDAEIERAERGEVTVLGAVSQRDRYQQFCRTARELLSDFREVEENFRRLDRSLREQIAGWDGSKGALLDEALGYRNSIVESDQGRSFQGFYDFLLSYERQAELTDLLGRLQDIEHIDNRDERMTHVHFDWIDASERAQGTVRQLSDQLRRFLDDRVWLESRRVIDLLKGIEAKALALHNQPMPATVMEIDETSISINLPMERPLFRRSVQIPIDSVEMAEGYDDLDISSLVGQVYVDVERLRQSVFRSLGRYGQIGLREVVAESPLENGLAELLSYLSLADGDLAVVFEADAREQMWWNAGDVHRVAEMPRVTFACGSGEGQ